MCMQLIVLLIVMMVNYVLLVDQLRMKAEWRFAMRISGEQCVVMAGVQKMLRWHVDSLVLKHLVS